MIWLKYCTIEGVKQQIRRVFGYGSEIMAMAIINILES
jgi:hypothetical protein